MRRESLDVRAETTLRLQVDSYVGERPLERESVRALMIE